MYKAYLEGVSHAVNKRSSIEFTITDYKGNVEYQHFELLDRNRNPSEIEMLAFNGLIEWLLENKINKINVYTNSRHVYANWKSAKMYNLNRNKLNMINVKLASGGDTYKNKLKNLAFA